MSLKKPDYLEHNNDALPIVWEDGIKGGAKAVATEAARNSIPVAMRKIGMLVTWYDVSVWVTRRYIGATTETVNWTNNENWEPIGVDLTADQFSAITEAGNPSASNVFATIADLPAEVSPELTVDELAAINGAATPSASNVFATVADIPDLALSEQIVATVPGLGITVGETFSSGTTFLNLFKAILAPYVKPSMSSLAVVLDPNDAAIEVGNTVDVVSASWSVANDSEGNPPQSMYLTGDGFDKAVTGVGTTGSGTTQLSVVGAKTWSLSGNDKDASPLTPATYSRSWRHRYWLGATNAADPVGDVTATALALALQQSQLLTSKAASFTCTEDNNTTGNYTWIAYLASYGALSNIIQDGATPVLGAFTYVGSWDVTNAYDVVASYRFYKSNGDKAFSSGVTLAIS